MKELIPINDNNGKKTVSARELHLFLESKREFATWIKDRIKKYELVENKDYVTFDEIVKRKEGVRGADVKTEYALSLSCAKELAMVEGNAKGKQARQYFIACEEKLKEITKPQSQIDIIIQSALELKETQERLSTIEDKVAVLEAKTTTRPNYFTILGYATLHKISVNIRQASNLGRKASDLCKKQGLQTDECPDPRFGIVKMYPQIILDSVFNSPIN